MGQPDYTDQTPQWRDAPSGGIVYSWREMRAAQILLLTTCVATSSLSAADGLKLGDPAPQFSLSGSDGNSYRLASYKGKQVVVLVWFAKAFTGG
jgi:hypothetical protein